MCRSTDLKRPSRRGRDGRRGLRSGSAAGDGQSRQLGRARGASAAPRRLSVPRPADEEATAPPSLSDSLAGVAQRAQQNKEKIRVEGFALGSDKDRVGESLKRANQGAIRLLAKRFDAQQIEVVATGRRAGRCVRISAVAGESKPQQPGQPAGAPGKPPSDEPSATPSSCRRRRSPSRRADPRGQHAEPRRRSQAGLLLRSDLARGSEKFAFGRALLDNPSGRHARCRPVTVLRHGQFLGGA